MFFSSYKGMYRYTSIWDLLNVVKANLIYSLSIFIIITSFYGYNVVVFSFLILDFILSNVFMNSTRIMIRMYFNHFKSFGRTNGNYYNKKNVVIIGAGHSGNNIARQILFNSKNNLNIIGFLDDDKTKNGRSLNGINVLGPVSILKQGQLILMKY